MSVQENAARSGHGEKGCCARMAQLQFADEPHDHVSFEDRKAIIFFLDSENSLFSPIRLKLPNEGTLERAFEGKRTKGPWREGLREGGMDQWDIQLATGVPLLERWEMMMVRRAGLSALKVREGVKPKMTEREWDRWCGVVIFSFF